MRLASTVAAHKGVPMLGLPRSLALIFLVVVATYAAEGFITVVLPPYLQSQGVPLDYIGAIVSALGGAP